MHQWFVPWVVQPLYERLSGRRPWTEARRLRELQWRSPEELEARAVLRLRALLEHAIAHVPYYGDLFRQAGISVDDVRTIADLARVPISEKRGLRANYPARTVADNLPARRRYPMVTSGSSGVPFEFYSDRADLDGWLGSYYFFREWDGTPLWGTRVRIVSSAQSYQTSAYSPRVARWARRLVTGEWVTKVSGVDLGVEDLTTLTRELSRRGPYTIDTYPSFAARLAAQLLRAGRELPAYPRVVVSGAETLTPQDAAIIESGFRCRVLNHYSSWEVPHLAQTCPDNPAVLHVNSERAIVRVVRTDGSTADRGERGRMVVTHLSNYVMPLINYDIGDWAVAGTPCTCGRGLPTVLGLDGRTVEMIRTPSGKVISPAPLSVFLAYQFPVMPYIWEFQAVQTAADALVLRVVPTTRFSSGFAAKLRAELETFLGSQMMVDIEPVEKIANEASGKRLIIKSQLPDV